MELCQMDQQDALFIYLFIIRNMSSGHENCRINKYINSASCSSIYIIGYDARYTQRQITWRTYTVKPSGWSGSIKGSGSLTIIHSPNVLEIHVCHKLRTTIVEADEAAFVYADNGHVCLKQHHVGGWFGEGLQ